MIILFTILKIVGILLAVIVLALAVILFFPVSYVFDGDIDGGDYRFRLNWLFGLVRFRLQYREKMEAVLRILFLKFDFTDPAKKKKRAERRTKKAEKKKRKLAREREKKKKALERARRKNRAEIDPDSEAEFLQTEEEAGKITADAVESAEETAAESGILPANVKKIFHILQSVYESQVSGTILPKLQVFLMHIRPRQLRGYVGFGFADPAVTGQVLGVVAAIPFLLGTELAVCPDFETEKTYVSGKVHIRGRIFVIHPVIFLIRMITDKKVRSFLRTLRGKKK